MTYEAAEAALAVLLRALANFEAEEVVIGDWNPVAHGHSNVAVLEYVRFEAERVSADLTTQIIWTCRINLLAEYEDDASAHNILRDRRDEIVLKILQNPTLSGTAFDAMVVGGEADDDDVDIGGISFLRETIDVEIEEMISA